MLNQITPYSGSYALKNGTFLLPEIQKLYTSLGEIFLLPQSRTFRNDLWQYFVYKV
jgi:hypothetical protein